MSRKKNSPQKQKKLSNIDYPYILKVLGICLITFIVGIFIGKKLTPQDNVQDLKKQIKQTDSQDQFTFFNTLPNQKPTNHSRQKTAPLPSTNPRLMTRWEPWRRWEAWKLPASPGSSWGPQPLAGPCCWTALSPPPGPWSRRSWCRR